MNYKQLTDKTKAQIDILLRTGLSMRQAAKQLGIHHSTISRYKRNVYSKRIIDIEAKYRVFIEFLTSTYDWRTKSIEVCIHSFKRYHPGKPLVSAQQVYNWINQRKISIKPLDTCYKRRKNKSRKNGMMNHLKWTLDNKTVFPIALRPKSIEKREEIGHLEIDSIIGKRNEYCSTISIVDRASRMIWLIKSESNNEYYTEKTIRNFIVKNEITVRSITTDNGFEFKALGITAKRLGVKLYKCDPYCSFQRGSNERANALVRRFIPKGKSMHDVSQQYLDDISFKINAMPRKIFDFKSAFQINYFKSRCGAVEI